MVVFQIVQNSGAWVIVNKFTAFIKECGIVFIGFNHEKRAVVLRQTGRYAEILWDAANQETCAVACIFQHPRQHRRGRGFTVRTRDTQYPHFV